MPEGLMQYREEPIEIQTRGEVVRGTGRRDGGGLLEAEGNGKVNGGNRKMFWGKDTKSYSLLHGSHTHIKK